MGDRGYNCPICGGSLVPLAHCKLRCRNCGLTEDCSDLFEGSAAAYSRPAADETSGDIDAPLHFPQPVIPDDPALN